MPVMVDSEGKYVSFTPTVPVAAGAIVALGELVGIAPVAIASGSVGQVAVRGIVRVPVTNTKAGQRRYRGRHQALVGHPRRNFRTLH
jgi:predicted RecA/RadA family phage recombinase